MTDNKLKEIDIYDLTYYFLDDMININDPVFYKTIFDEKPYEDMLKFLMK